MKSKQEGEVVMLPMWQTNYVRRDGKRLPRWAIALGAFALAYLFNPLLAADFSPALALSAGNIAIGEKFVSDTAHVAVPQCVVMAGEHPSIGGCSEAKVVEEEKQQTLVVCPHSIKPLAVLLADYGYRVFGPDGVGPWCTVETGYFYFPSSGSGGRVIEKVGYFNADSDVAYYGRIVEVRLEVVSERGALTEISYRTFVLDRIKGRVGE